MKKIKNILASALLLFSGALFAQQQTALTLYRYQMNVVNPAYAGVSDETLLGISFRSQWTGIKDSPKTQVVTFGTGIGHNLGLGVSLVNDKTFIEEQVMVGVDVSYKVKMNETNDLYLGIKAGGNFYSVNTSGLQTYLPESDPALSSINDFNPNVGVGALWKNEKYYVSFSVPAILNTERAKEENGIVTSATDRPHLYLSGGYDFDLNPEGSLVLRPSIMSRYVTGAPLSVDVNAMLQIQKCFEIGATYRTDEAFAAMFDFTISKQLMVGYAYEVSTKTELASAKNTSEFLVRLKF